MEGLGRCSDCVQFILRATTEALTDMPGINTVVARQIAGETVDRNRAT